MNRDQMRVEWKMAASKINEAMQSGNVGILAETWRKAEDIAFRLERSPADNYLIEVACGCFLIDGENPEIIEKWAMEKKRKAAERDPELRAFFFEIARALMNTLAKSSAPITANSSKAKNAVPQKRAFSSSNKSVTRALVSSNRPSPSQTETPT
jgi:hypothetical protein